MARECFTEVSTEPPWRPTRGLPIHQASCECGWKGRRRRDWSKACDEADDHMAKARATLQPFIQENNDPRENA